MDIKGNNKYLIIVLIIIVIVCIALASFLVLSNNNNTDDSNNTTTNTSIAPEVNTRTSTSSEEYDPWGYGNDVYHYDAATDTYLREDSDCHFIYDKVYDKWHNVDIQGQYEGGTQQGINDFIDTVE